MEDSLIALPAKLKEVQQKCYQLGFSMASDIPTGSLLRSLVASKPGGKVLEFGTGIGDSLCWMLAGLDAQATLVSIDNDPELIEIARSIFGDHPSLSLVCDDGAEWIRNYKGAPFDLVFADAWPGKYSLLEETLNLLKVGGFYVIDDMLPQPNWPEGHAEKAQALTRHLTRRADLAVTMLKWSTGVMVCTKQAV